MRLNSTTRLLYIFFFFFSFITASYGQAPNQPVNPVPSHQSVAGSINPDLCATVSDPNGGTLQVRYHGRKVPANGTEKFTIILLPDTQYYTEEPQGNHQGGIAAMFNAQTAWIANNRQSMNIVYVGQLGDCTQNGDNPPGANDNIEWERANTAISTIESQSLTGLAQGIPYGISVGNHDQTPGGGGNTAATTRYNQYFGISRFSGRNYYGGHHGTNNDNHYQLFSASGIDFLVISMEYDTSPETSVLDWAANLVQTYSTRKVIVMTHFGINETGSPQPSFGTQGLAIYDRLKQYPNFMLFVCGHIHQADGEARRSDIFNGNTVHTILSDYQERPGGGNGLLRIMEFDPAQNKISVKTYSPYTNTYETDADSQFELSFNMLPVIGQVNSVPSGTNRCFTWNNLLNETGYEWNLELYDGQNVTRGPVWKFTTPGADITPPTVSSVTPIDGATGTNIGTTVSAVFNEAMNATTINSSTVELRDPASALIAATVSYNATTRTATLTPSAALANLTVYTAKVISGAPGVKDVAGNDLATNYSWSFTTVAGDITPPTVTSVVPVSGSQSVSINTTVSAVFNEAMNATNINTSTIQLRNPALTLIPANVSYNATTRTATLTPLAALANLTLYTAKVIGGTPGVKDVAGNDMASDYSWTFTTVAGDITPPTVSSVTPGNGALSISINTIVSAVFNEAMNASNINTSTIQLRNPALTLIPATVSYNATTRTATLTPLAALVNLTLYTATVIGGAAGVKDVAGNDLASDYSWSFTTVAGDITPPTVTSVMPLSGSLSAPINTTVSAVFNEAMDANTINSTTIELRDPASALIPATVSYDAGTRTATLTPMAALSNSIVYTARVISGAQGVKDVAGNALAVNYSWSFTTVAPTTQPPVAIQSFTTRMGTALTTHSLTGVPAGALLVLATTSDAALSNCTVSSSPALTWTKRVDAGAVISDNAEIWTAVYSAGGSITITSNWGAVSQASVCYIVLNAEPSLGGASGTAVSQSAPSVTVTTTRANSIIFGCTADWNAVNGATRTLRDAAIERLYHKDVNFTTYYYTKAATSIAAYTEGISLPTGQRASTALLEIRGNTGAADITPPTVTSVTPVSTGVPINTTVSAVFNEAMNAATISISTIELRNPANGLIAATVSYDAGTRTATLTPAAALVNSTTYTARVISGALGVKDVAGNALASNYSWSFTTGTAAAQPPVSIQSFTTRTGTAATTHALTGVPAGALLVLATTSDAALSNCTVSSSPALTWTKRVDAGAVVSDNAEIWTAVYSAGGSITVTTNWGAVSQASVCYIVLNAEPTLGGVSGTAVSQSAPSVTITTTRANSIIFGCTADWNAVNGATRTLRDAAIERLYHKDVNFTTYYYTKAAASIAAYTEGISFPTGQQASTALLEIRSISSAQARLANPPITKSKVQSHSLGQNYPNPFDKGTTIQFTLPKAETVNLTLFDISGRIVKVLVNGSKDAGTHAANFNAGSLANGVYYYRMQAGDFTDVKKLTIR